MRNSLFLLIALLVFANPAKAQELIMSDEEARRIESEPAPLTEYDNVPEGMLLGAREAPTPEEPVDVNYLAQIPGYYEIPDVGEKKDEEQILSMEKVLLEYKKGNYKVVLKNLEPMAENGQHEAEEILGIMYLTGQGVAVDEKRALALLESAAEANKTVAQHYLGIMYYTGGKTFSADTIKALQWIQLALLHYPDGPEKERAAADYGSIYAKSTRIEKSRAMEGVRNFLIRYNELHLLDME